MELSKPDKIAYDFNDECLNPQIIEKTKISLAARIFFTYYVKNGHPEWEGALDFLKLIAKWWSPVNVKSVSKGTRKRDIDMEPLDSTNIGRFTEFMHKFATWLNEWMLFGKRGFSKQTFSSCLQTSQSFPLLIQH